MFSVFTHLPLGHLSHGLTQIRARFPALEWLMLTVLIAPNTAFAKPWGRLRMGQNDTLRFFVIVWAIFLTGEKDVVQKVR